ncbi:MAG: CDP-diacylglycerol--serine O-phosphatidyltransferase, partial [Bacteroidales bacterium]
FLGLPTPANAFFLLSLVFWVQPETGAISGVAPWMYVAIALLFSGLLVSEIPMFSLKVKHLAWKGNQIRYLFLALSLLLAGFLQMRSLTLIIPLYILLSIASSLKKSA